MVRSWTLLTSLALVSLALTLSGCNKTDNATLAVSAGKGGSKKDVDQDRHAHKPGAHNGIIVPIGADSYHAEAVFEKNGALRLYTLGADEARIMEVDAEPMKAFVKAEGDAEQAEFVLQPEPQTGDTKGKTSSFLGQLPPEKVGKKVDVTIPIFRVGTERFRISFSNVKDEHKDGHKDDHNPLPIKKATSDQEAKLYLEPGGIYTLADIKANGNMTASEKFKGFRAVHDMNPRIGDKICPITETLANPKCSWIVNGITYEFCCPPCVDEFVARAKEDPASIKAPSEYVKKQ